MKRLLLAVILACAVPASPVRAEDSEECTVWGTAGNDVLVGTPEQDVLCGFGGDDTLIGGGGNDIIYGGPGADLIWGGDGSDTLLGDAGNDWLDGDGGADRISGGEGYNWCEDGENLALCVIDRSIPQLVAISVAWDNDSLTGTARMRWKDTGSGLLPYPSCAGDQCGSFSLQWALKRNHRWSVSTPQFAYQRIAGTARDGIYEVLFSIPAGYPAGTYELRTVWVRDAAGNEAMLNSSLSTNKLRVYVVKR